MMQKSTKKMQVWKKILFGIISVLCIFALAYGLLLLYLTATEYKPEATEKLALAGEAAQKEISLGDSLKIMTWNVGYGALGDNADFFMDGGSHVNTADQTRVSLNLEGISRELKAVSPDVVFLQEVDRDSARSHYLDEMRTITDKINGYQNVFAYNYRTEFIPYPWPPIGKVQSGILTLSRYQIVDAERVQLPCPFSWPIRLAQLKRCLMINRIPIAGTDHELVLVNLHLEAYDDGEGKKAQTQMLQSILQKESEAGNYVIAGGDFNQTFSNTDISAFPVFAGKWHAGSIAIQDFGSAWQMRMDSAQPSCRSLDQPYAGSDKKNFQYYVIDGFIVSANIQINSCRTQNLQFQNSDHNPVVMEVTLK